MWRWKYGIFNLFLIYFISNSDGQWYKKKIAAKELCASKRFDLYLLLETSAFVGGGNMVYLKKYLQTIVAGIDVKHTHISIVTFDNKITERLSLKSGSVKSAVDDVIGQLHPSGYGVSARQTMRYAADKLFTSEFGRRDDVPAVCLLFVAYPFVGDYQDAATHLKTKCRLAIAGAKYARLIQMFQVASQPSTRHSVFSRRFKDLKRRTDSTLQVLCEPPLVSPRLTKEGFTAESIAIKWKAQPFASSFLLQLKKSSSLKVLREVSVPSSQSSFVFEKLPPRTNYQIHVWPVDAKGKNGPVGRMVASTGIKAPSLEVDNSSITDTSVRILMDRSIDVNLKYFAVATAVEDDADQANVLVSGSYVQLTGLEPGTKYHFKLNGYRKLRTSDTLEEVAPLLFSTGPSSPKVEAVSITKRSATIKWATIASATHYKVIVNDVTDDVQTMYDEVIETGFLITSLQPSHTYFVRVVACGNDGLESRSERQIKIFTGPANPNDISLLQVSENEVELMWNDVEDTTEYWIYVDEGKAADRKFMKKITTISNTYQISGLGEGSWFTFTIYSTDEAQTIDENIVYPLQVQTVPLPPSRFSANSTSSTITIGWETPQGAHSYEVYMDGDYQDDVTSGDVTIEQLLPGEEYEIAVRTISESGKKSEMSKKFPFATLPPASTDVQATNIWTNGATVQWEPAMRAYGYKIVLLDSDKNPEVEIMTQETEAEVTNLQAGTFYNVSIYTIGSDNRMNEHERATVLFQTVAEPPKFVQIREYGPSSLTVRWQHVNGAHGYRVSVTNDDVSGVDVTSNSYLVFGRNEETIFRLNSVTQYRIIVYTINYFNKESRPSAVLMEYTLPETPDLPRVVEVATEMLQLDWPDVGGIERYVVHIENNETEKKWELSAAVSEVTIYDLTPGTWYDIHISSVGVTGRTNQQRSRLLSTQTLPSTPANVRIRQYSTNTISVSWNKVHGARNYLLTVYDAISYDVTKRISVNGVYATVRDVEAGTEYQVEVSAVGQDYRRFGKPSEPLQVFTDPLPPNQPTATLVMSTKIGLEWNVVKGARAYLVEVWNPTFSTELETNTNEIVVENLTPGFLYNFTIFSIGHAGTNNNKPSPKLMLYTTPSPPTNVRILNIKSMSAEIEWNPAEGANGYVVSVQGLNGNGRNGDIYVNNFTTTRALVDQHLTPGTFYAIFVQTIGIAGPISEKKEFVEFMTLPGNPGKPRLEKVRVYSVSVSWEKASGAAYYLLNLKRMEDGVVDFVQSDSPPATLGGLRPGTSYQLHVEAFNTMDGASLNISHVLSFRTAPKGVEDFRIESVTDTAIALRWTSTDGAEYYSLETSSKGRVMGTHKIEENEVVMDGLSPGQTYVFQIVPVGLSGETGSLSSSVTETTIPNKPIPTIRDYGENFIRITWDDIEGAATYKVVTDGESLLTPRMTSTGTNTATITNLAPGSWHTFVIFSVDVKNRQSLTGSAPLSAMTAPRQVGNIEFEDISQHSFRVTWSQSKGAAVYLLEVTSSTDENYHMETNMTSSTLMGLQSGSEYDVIIKMRDESGRVHDIGSKSSTSTLPEPVEIIQVENIGTNEVTLKWPKVRGATKYRLVTTVPEGVRKAETRDEHINLGGLIPGRFYEISAYSIGRADIENPTPSPTLVVQTAPLPPDPPTFSDVTTTSFTVAWNSVFGSSGYQLTATSSDGSEDIIVNDVISTSYSLESLTGGTEYVVHVVTNGQQDGRTSEPSSVATVNTVCLTPEKATIVEVTTSSVTLQWDPVKGAVGYDVEVAGDEVSVMSPAPSTAHVTIDSLSAGIRYNFTVYSIGKYEVRNDEGSIPVLVQIAPTAPEEMDFPQIATTYVSMTWESVGLSSYDVRVMTLGGSVVQDLSNRRSPLLVTSLGPGEVYLFGVTSVGDGGYRSEESDLVEQATLPVAVESLTVRKVTSTTISASWTPTAGSQSYVLVAHSTGDEDEGMKITTSQTNAVLRGLRAGHWYSLTVISIGKSSLTNQYPSELARVQTVCLPPGDVEIEQVTTTTIQLSWRQPHGVSFYELEVLALDAEFQTANLKSLIADGDEIVIRKLLPGVSYMARISSINEEGRKSDPTPKIYESTHPASATGLNVIDLNSTSVSINWTPVHGAHEYRILSQDIITSQEILLIRTADNLALISDLSPGTKYQFVVFTYDTKNRSSNRGSDVLHVETVPLPPTSINVSDVTTTDMTLQWNEVKGAVAYKVRYGLMGDNEALQIINTTMTSLVISPLQSGCRYWFAIRSGGGQNQLSESSRVVSRYTLPTPPISIEVEASSDSITFYWNPVKGAIRYDGRLVAADGNPLLSSSQVSNLTYAGLEVGRFYNFTVKSVGEERTNEEASDIVLTQTAPGKPHGLVVIGTSTTSVQLDWDDLSGATSYLVMGENSDGDLGEKEVATSSANLAGLEPGTTYQFDVQALGYEDVAGIASDPITAVTIPRCPSIVSLDSIAANSVTLSWKPTKGAVSYVLMGTELDGRNAISAESTQIMNSNLSGLRSGTFYKFVVLARGVNGILNEEEGARIQLQTVPSPPASGHVSNITDVSMILKWLPSTGASSYIVRVTSDENEVISSSISEELQITDLLPGTEYQIYLQSVGEEGGISDQKLITSEITYPSAMKHIEAKFVSSTKVSLAWDVVTGATSYQVFVKSKEQVVSFDALPGRIFAVEDTTVEVDELTPGAYYLFRVFSIGKKERRNEEDAAFIRVQTVTSSPMHLQASKVQTDSAVFTWNKVRGAEKYLVYFELELSDVHNTSNIVETTHNQVDMKQVFQPGQRYWVAVKAVNYQGKMSEGGEAIFITTQPEAVRNLTSYDVTNSSITLSWHRPIGAWKFEVQTRNLLTDEKSITTTSSNIYMSNNLLQSGVKYQFYVTSIGMFDVRNSDKNSFIVAQVAPAAPTEVRITSITNISIALQWKESFGATSYEITWWLDDDVIESRNSEKTVESSFTVTSLTPGDEYTITIESCGGEDDDVIHRHNNEMKVQTRTDPPNFLQVFKITEDAIHVKWRPANGAQEYLVQVVSHDDNENIDIRKSSISKLVINNLGSGVKYDIFVRSVDTRGQASDRDARLLDLQTISTAPTSFVTMEITTDSITVSWDPSHGAVSYILKYGATNNKDDINMMQTSDEIATVDQLLAGVEYWLAVKAVAENDMIGRESEEIIETTVPATPSNFRVYDVTQEAVYLDWDTIKGSSGYLLTVEPINITEEVSSFQTTVSRYQLNNLTPGEVYKASVKSVGHNGITNHNASEHLLIQTGIGAPANLVTSSVSTSSFNVSWDAVYGALMYEVRLHPHTDDSNIGIYETKQTSISIDQLDFGTLYYVTVRGHGFNNAPGRISTKLEEATLPLPPSDLVVTHITTDSAFLMWTAQKGVTSYNIHLTAELNLYEATVINTRTSHVNVTGLLPGTEYLFVVYSIGTPTDSHDGVNPKSSQVIERQTVCSPPSGLNISDVGASSMIISWTPSNGAVMYEVEMETGKSQLPPDIFLLPESEVRLASLLPDTAYYFTIRAINAENRSSDASERIHQTTLISSAKNIRIVDHSTTSATLSWEPLAGVERYRVVMENIDEDENMMFDVGDNHLVVDSLHPGTLYEITVFAVEDGQVLREGSEPTTLLTLPESPTNFQVDHADSSTIQLSWKSAHGADHYEVKYAPTLTPQYENIHFSFSNKLTISHLESGREYKFRISTIGRLSEQSGVATELIETTDPLSPEVVSSEELGEDFVVLDWQIQQGAFGYSISYKHGETVEEVFAEKPPYTLSPLDDMTSYEIVVRSVGVRGVIPEGSQVLRIYTDLLSPKNFRVTTVGTNSIRLDWDDFKDSTGYKIYYQTGGDEAEHVIEASVASEYVMNENINSGTNYQISVTSINTNGSETVPSQVVRLTTMVHPPALLELVKVDSTSATISWTQVTGATSYRVQVTDDDDDVTMDQKVDDVTMVVEELSPATNYYVRVASRDKLERQSPKWSEIVAIITTPANPSGMNVAEVSTSSLTFTWNQAQGASLYEIAIHTESGGSSNVESGNNLYQINNLLPGEEVTAKIISKSAAGVRNGEAVSITHRTILSAPSGLSATTLNYSSIQLSWNPLERALTYTIHISSEDSSSPKKSLLSQSFWKIEDITTTHYEVDNLKAATLYNFQLSADNYDGVEGMLSSSVSAITGSIELASQGHSWLMIKWPQFQFATTYTITYVWKDEWDEVQQTILEKETSDLIQQDGAVFGNVTSLFPDMQYSFKIRASGLHLAEETELKDFTAATLQLLPPSNIRVAELRANHVIVSWDVYQYATSYDVKLVHKITQDIKFQKNVEGNTVLMDGLRTLEVYTLRIRSVAHGGRSISSTPLQIQPRHPTPVLPHGVAPELISRSPSSLVVKLETAEFAASYHLQLYDVSENLLQTKLIPKTDVGDPVVIGNLKDNFFYKISYSATGFGGDIADRSAFLNTSTTRQMPQAPQNVKLLTRRAGYVVISFDWSKYSISHSVIVTNRYKGTIQKYRNVMSPYRITSLTVGDAYLIKVNAHSKYGDVIPSDALSVEIPYPTGGKVRVSRPSGVTDSGFRVQWSPTPYTSSYKLTLTIGSNPILEVRNVASNQYDFIDLRPSTTYWVKVEAIGRNGVVMAKSSYIKARTGAEFTKSHSGNSLSRRGDEHEVDLDDELFEQLLQAILDTTDSVEEASLSELNRYKVDLEKTILQLHEIYNYSAASSDYNRPLDIKKLNDLGRKLKPMVGGKIVTPLSELDGIGREISEIFMEITGLDEVLTDDEMKTFNKKLRDMLRQLLSIKGLTFIDASEGFGKNRNFAMSFSLVTSHGFRVSWLRFRNSHRYLVILVEQGDDAAMVHNETYLGVSAAFDNLSPDAAYNVTVIPLSANGLVMNEFSTSSIVVTKSQNHKLVAEISSIGNRHIVVSWKVWPTELSGVTFTLSTDNALSQRKVVTRRASHRVLMFTGLASNTQYQIVAVSTDGEVVYEAKATTQSSTSSVRGQNEKKTRVMLPPTNIEVLRSVGQEEVTISWKPPSIEGVPPEDISYSVGLYRPERLLLVKLIRRTHQTEIIFTDVESGGYDVRIRSHNDRAPGGKPSPYSSPIRVTIY